MTDPEFFDIQRALLPPMESRVNPAWWLVAAGVSGAFGVIFFLIDLVR